MSGLNKDDIIRMAREVADIQTDSLGREEFIFDSYGIEAFANLVAAAEREACANLVELERIGFRNDDEQLSRIAATIRARGKQ